MSQPEPTSAEQLREIVACLREQLQWQAACGVWGVQLRARDQSSPQPSPTRALPPQPSPEPLPQMPEPTPLRRPASAPAPVFSSAKTARYEPAADVMTPEQRLEELAELTAKAATCAACRLGAARKQAVVCRGNPLSELMIVGEGPGADEDAHGVPLVGRAGQLLDRMIAAMGFGLDEVYIANVVKCRPPENRTPEQDEIDACMPFLHRQIELVSPKAIVAMGGTALRGLLGLSGITRLRGKWKLYRGVVPVMPTFHPAYLLRQESAKRDAWNDLKEVMKLFNRTPPQRGSQKDR